MTECPRCKGQGVVTAYDRPTGMYKDFKCPYCAPQRGSREEMTDGIVQESIKPLLDFYLNHEEEFYYESNDIAMVIQKLQQELIEKINQEFADKTGYSNEFNDQVRRKLIGDATSQEKRGES